MQPHPNPQTPAEDDAYYRAILHDLIDRGAALARHIHEQATAATPTPENRPESDPTIALDRIARAIRRTIALARHIAAGPAAPPSVRTATRARLIRGVEDAIHRKRHMHEGIDTDSLHAEFAERLEDPGLEFDLQGRPVGEVIEEICQDLGIAMQGRSYIHKRRTPDDIAAIRTRAAAPPTATLHLIQGGSANPQRKNAPS